MSLIRFQLAQEALNYLEKISRSTYEKQLVNKAKSFFNYQLLDNRKKEFEKKKIIENLEEKKVEIGKLEKNEEDLTEQKFESTFAYLAWTRKKFDENLHLLTPKQRHLYHQKQKEILNSATFSEIDKKALIIQYAKNANIKYYNSPEKQNFHFILSIKLLEILDKKVSDKFQNAFNGGFAKRKKDIPGIKFLKHQLIELKINN